MDLEDELKIAVRNSQTTIEHFCRMYNVELKSITLTDERGYPEAAYHFSDNLGYYTIDGIKKSLD